MARPMPRTCSFPKAHDCCLAFHRRRGIALAIAGARRQTRAFISTWDDAHLANEYLIYSRRLYLALYRRRYENFPNMRKSDILTLRMVKNECRKRGIAV